MIRISEPPQRPEPSTSWHAGFLAMLPKIRRQASLAFCGLPKATREDLIDEVVVNALVRLFHSPLTRRSRDRTRRPGQLGVGLAALPVSGPRRPE